MSIINSQPLIGASGQGGYFLSKSLRFRSSASAYLDRTPSSAGNQRTWTISFWTKINPNGNNTAILANNTSMRFGSTADSNTITVNHRGAGGTNYFLISNPVYRDPSAWYHVVWAVDTTQATESNRSKIYVNGVQVTSFSTANYPPQNQDTSINASGVLHYIGRTSTVYYYDGYLAEYNLIDGQALTPSSFGETSTSTGVWIPKKYTGTYGTNGFYLPFTDVATTSGSNAGLGKDFSGNGNYWTTNNISVTSGATYDSMKDVPTLTDADTANYAVMNPLWKDSGTSISDGNLNVSGGNSGGFSTLTIPTNSKFYAEFTVTATQGNQGVGIIKALSAYSGAIGDANIFSSNGVGYYAVNGNKYVFGSSSAYGSSWGTIGDVIGIAVNTVDNQITFYKNNVSQGVITGLTSSIEWVFATTNQTASGAGAWNFGQRPFAYTPPTGFKALNTFNLPTPTIGATASTTANKYFDVVLWTGNGTSTTVSSLNFQPDMMYGKSRSSASWWPTISDAVRGAGKILRTNSTDAELSNYGLTSFNSNGFTTDSDGTYNANGATYVAWNWKANGSGSTNTAGSITSTVSANTTAGFSICTFAKGNVSNQTFGHGLGVAPKFIIYKNKGATSDWWCYHESLGNTKSINLNLTSAASTDTTYWNSTSPTSTVATMGTYWSSGNFVAYCFAEVAGYSAFGSYTGNGSSDGVFVYTGFRPKFILRKWADGSNQWVIFDTARDTYNVSSKGLYPNLSNAEETLYNQTDILSNGFKMRTTDNSVNGSGGTYIYMAFAENPFKFSNAR